MTQSEIRRMTRECVERGGINLAQGNTDLPPPPVVLEAAISAIQGGKNTYTFPEGVSDLRERIAKKLRRDNGIEADPESEIVVTSGASAAYTATLSALLDPGDGILICEPYYEYHANTAQALGLEVQFLSLAPPDFLLSENDLSRAIKSNTRALVLCSPANPSGKMLRLEEIQAVARVCSQRDILLVTDEVYEYIRYDGRPHISPATVGDLWDRTVTITSMSKTFSVTGWRVGYAVAPPHLARSITLTNDLFYVCAPTPLQHGIIAGLDAPPEVLDDLVRAYTARRDLLCSALDEARLSPIVPEGAYYVLADVSKFAFSSARDAALTLLRETGVASVPGSAFYRGDRGNGLLRFCFAKREEVLEEACQRIRRFDPGEEAR